MPARSWAEEAPVDPGAEPTSFVQAFKKGTYRLALRYRFESVSEDAFDKDANASTLRTVLNMETKSWKRIRLVLEFENVADIGTDGQYNNKGVGDRGNGVTDRPVVADVAGTEVNQAYLGVTIPWGSDLKLGRWVLVLADERFVGPVGWRQNFQSFDGGLVTSRGSNGKLRLTAGYIDRVNTIFGGTKGMRSPIVDLGYELGVGTVTLYAYELDYDQPADAELSTRTLGARFNGSHVFGKNTMSYHAQYAQQDDTGDNPTTVDAQYARLELGGRRSGFSGGLGYELLSGGAGKGKLTTPLATLHKFNGWADKFLATPDTGLQDTWIHVGWSGKGVVARAIYHQFDADTGGDDYGSELDLLVSYTTSWKQLFAVQASRYDADTFSTDTDKAWFFTQYAF